MTREAWRERLQRHLDEAKTNIKTVSLKAGVSETYVRDLLKRGREPGIDKLTAIARALDVSVGYLLGEEDENAGVLPVGRVRIEACRLEHGAGLPLPSYESEQAAGLDLAAAVPDGTPETLAPGARALIPAGFAMKLPPGFEGQVRPRSGLAFKHGVTVLNSPGTIDADYRGEVKVLLINLGESPFEITRGMRIAQLVVQPVSHATLVEVEELADSERGHGGFGSTGTG